MFTTLSFINVNREVKIDMKCEQFSLQTSTTLTLHIFIMYMYLCCVGTKENLHD